MKITRGTDRLLKSSATLRVLAVAFLWLPMSGLFGAMLMESLRYFWGIPHGQRVFYAFIPALLVMEAVLLRSEWISVLVCDVDDSTLDMKGYEHLSAEELAAALGHRSNVWRRRFHLFSTASIHGFLGVVVFAGILNIFHDLTGWRLIVAGLAAFAVYVAVFALVFDHSLQGMQKFRWRRNSSKPLFMTGRTG